MNDQERATVEQALERLRKYHHGNGFAEDAECIASLESALAQEQPEPACERVMTITTVPITVPRVLTDADLDAIRKIVREGGEITRDDKLLIDRTLLEQALDALLHRTGGSDEVQRIDAAITDLCAALAQPDIDPMDEYRKGFIDGQIDMRDRPEEPAQHYASIPGTNVRVRLQPEPTQEPIGYLWPTGRHPEFRFTQQKRHGVDGTPVYTAPPEQPEPAQEPVAWVFRHSDGTYHDPSVTEHSAGMVPLGPIRAQRPPLTDEEIRAHADKHLRYQPQSYEASGVLDLARAIERKVRGETE